jgi:cytoskeleton protein RodZ
MSSDTPGEPARGIGARLRAARERRGLTVLQAAEKLHVDARVLEALETEDFASLGAAVYVRGHLRRYAELTGEPAEQLQELYSATAPPIRPDLTRIPRSETRERSSPLMLPALLLVVGVALAGALWWVMKLPGGAQPLPASPPAPLASGEAPAGSEATGASPPGAAPRDGTAPASAPASAAGGAADAGQARLELSFSAPSWVEVSDARGQHLLQGLMPARSSRSLAGSPPLRLTLGNAPAVSVQLNGRGVPLAGLARHDGSAHVQIDASGRASVAASRLAHGD